MNMKGVSFNLELQSLRLQRSSVSHLLRKTSRLCKGMIFFEKIKYLIKKRIADSSVCFIERVHTPMYNPLNEVLKFLYFKAVFISPTADNMLYKSLNEPIHTAIRYLQGEERETVEHKSKILKRELKHIIEELTYINNFVFADPHKKEATHIAHICKSHMPTHKPIFAKECNFFQP